MKLDVRIPIGLLLSMLGAILTALGASGNGNAALYAKSLGINVNLYWGIVLLVAGQAIFHLGRRGQSRLLLDSKEDSRQLSVRRKS